MKIVTCPQLCKLIVKVSNSMRGLKRIFGACWIKKLGWSNRYFVPMTDKSNKKFDYNYFHIQWTVIFYSVSYIPNFSSFELSSFYELKIDLSFNALHLNKVLILIYEDEEYI